MDTRVKLGLGSLFALVGALGFILGPALGAAAFGRPWSFIAGFLAGVLGGIGVVLCIDGLLAYRRERESGTKG